MLKLIDMMTTKSKDHDEENSKTWIIYIVLKQVTPEE